MPRFPQRIKLQSVRLGPYDHGGICRAVGADPGMLARLDEIEADLLARRERAANEGWLGEIEGLDLTLSFLRAKRARTQRFTRRVQRSTPQ